MKKKNKISTSTKKNQPSKAKTSYIPKFLLPFFILLIGLSAFLYYRFRPVAQSISINQIGSPVSKVLVGVRFFGSFPSNHHTIRNEISAVYALPEWKHLQQYFSVVWPDGTVTIDEDDQLVIDQEIQLASAAGIDYFAFESMPNDVDSDEDASRSYPMYFYLKSPYKNSLKFALTLGPASLMTGSHWKENVKNNLAIYFNDPQYVTVDNGRPLLYIVRIDNVSKGKDLQSTKDRIDAFRKEIKAVTGNNPYLVLMDLPDATNYFDNAADLGFDARSSYLGSNQFSNKGESYLSLAQTNMSYWNTLRNSGKGIGVIPTVSVGMDPRPKAANYLYHYGKKPTNIYEWYQQGTPDQIASNVEYAMKWVRNNSKYTRANTILLSSWNEGAESSWLVPTLSEGNARLNSLAKVLGGKQRQVPKSPYIDNPFPKLTKGELIVNSPSSGSKIRSRDGLIISGIAPTAARITIKIGDIKTFFINGKSSNPTGKFKIKIDSPPTGVRDIVVSSPDTNTVTIPKVKIQ